MPSDRLLKGAFSMILAACLLAGGVAEGAAPKPAETNGKKISLRLKQADLIDVLNLFSKKTGWNLVIAPEVTGTVSLHLHEVSIEEALAAVARITGYAIERIGQILYVTSREKVEGFPFPEEPMHKTYKLYYMGAQAAATVVKRYLSPYGKLAVNKSKGLLFIEDTPETFTRIEPILRTLDQPPKQVLIEARILEVQLNNGFSYGVDWKAVFDKGKKAGTLETKGFATPPDGGTQGFFFSLTTPDVTALLNALQQEGTLNTLATPKLLALNHKPAKIVIGGRLGFRVTTTSNQITTESVEFLDTGTQLRLTPHIDNQGNILMEIHPEISDGVVTEGLPSKTTTEVTTTLLARDGESIFIGGLIRTREEEVIQRVPLLGHIPILGYLFRNTEIKRLKSEIIVIITPHLEKAAFLPPVLE